CFLASARANQLRFAGLGRLDPKSSRSRNVRALRGWRPGSALRGLCRARNTRRHAEPGGLMDAKQLNAIVHDREAAFYDDRFLIAYDGRIGRDVARDLRRVTGDALRARRALDLACGTGYAAIGLAAAALADEVHASD